MNDDICFYIRSGCDFLSLWQKVYFYFFVSILVLIIAIAISIIAVIAAIVLYFKHDNNEQKADIEEYFEAHYGDTDYVIDKMFNNFPISGYVAKISSPSSQDIRFELIHISKGDIEDTYEEDVLSGSNTLERVEDAYNQLVNKTIEEYDVCDLVTHHVMIAIYAHDEEIEYEIVQQIMLQVKEIIDDADIPFLKMSVTLREPLNNKGNTVGNDRMEFYGVPYEKIEEDGLLQYLKENEDTP